MNNKCRFHADFKFFIRLNIRTFVENLNIKTTLQKLPHTHISLAEPSNTRLLFNPRSV